MAHFTWIHIPPFSINCFTYWKIITPGNLEKPSQESNKSVIPKCHKKKTYIGRVTKYPINCQQQPHLIAVREWTTKYPHRIDSQQQPQSIAVRKRAIEYHKGVCASTANTSASQRHSSCQSSHGSWLVPLRDISNSLHQIYIYIYIHTYTHIHTHTPRFKCIYSNYLKSSFMIVNKCILAIFAMKFWEVFMFYWLINWRILLKVQPCYSYIDTCICLDHTVTLHIDKIYIYI